MRLLHIDAVLCEGGRQVLHGQRVLLVLGTKRSITHSTDTSRLQPFAAVGFLPQLCVYAPQNSWRPTVGALTTTEGLKTASALCPQLQRNAERYSTLNYIAPKPQIVAVWIPRNYLYTLPPFIFYPQHYGLVPISGSSRASVSPYTPLPTFCPPRSLPAAKPLFVSTRQPFVLNHEVQ